MIPKADLGGLGEVLLLRQGLAAWSGFALIHLTALLFLLFLFRLGMGG
jgi:hypothetical protein